VNVKAIARGVLRYAALGVIIALLALAILNGGSGLPKGTRAPPIVGQRLDGAAISSTGFDGKPAVINFWATWCPPCLGELPEFERAYKAFGDRVAFIGLAVESGSRADVADVVQRFGLSYPIALPHPEVQHAYRVTSYPTTIIIAPDGTVVHSHAGAIDFELLARELAPWLGPGQS